MGIEIVPKKHTTRNF